MVIGRCRDVDEAVALAERLRAQGKYDWFRGQVEDWPLRTSLNRVAADLWSQAVERLE